MEVRIQTLTPIWTGGADGRMDRIHETGVIGSMRWWYEAIVRGLGGSACDLSFIDKCRYNSRDMINSREHRPPREQLCPACYVFGATGWRRRFRADVVDNTKPIWTQESSMLNIRPPDRDRGWYLPPGRMGDLILNFEGDKETLSLLAALLLFLEKWGSIGAKPQLGYGVFKITNRSVVQSHAQHFWQEDAAIYKEKSTSGHNSDVDLPDMRHFGFVSYHFKPQKATWWTHAPGLERVAVEVQPIVRDFRTAPLAPPLKNEWRFRRWYLESMDKKRIQEMWMFGALRFPHKGELCRVRSKVAVSWAYPVVDGWEMRSWAWLQDQGAASKVWELMRDEGSWEAAIKLPGKINSYPDGPWNVWDIKDLAEFLEGTKW